jgi:hypothetical protein
MNCVNCGKLTNEDYKNCCEIRNCETIFYICNECEDNDDIYDKYFIETSYITECRKCYDSIEAVEHRKKQEEIIKKKEEIRLKNKPILEQKILENIKRQHYWLNKYNENWLRV